MGGFRIDGCGTKEYFKKVKYLGERNCPQCKRNTPYYLEKANYKVSVFYIPTVTLKERYAIICERCDYGKYIEDAEAYKILSGDSNASLNTESTNNKTEERHENLMNKKTCPQCGAEIDGMFCGACGTKYVEPTPTPVTPVSIKKCPNCGTAVDGMFCGACGTKYVEPTPTPANPVSIKKCPKCGAAVDGMFCGACGAKYVEPTPTPTPANPVSIKKCPKCGAAVDGMFCGACGTKYVELKISDPIPEPPTPQPIPEAQEWECPLCGTKNPKSAAVCSLCGNEKTNNKF